MIILTSTTDKIELVLTNSVTTNELSCVVSFRDTTTNSIVPVRNVILSNGITPISLVTSPSSSTQRVVDYISVFNTDTSVAEVTISFVDNTTSYRLFVSRLASGDKLEFQEGYGFKVTSNGYSTKTSNTFAGSTLNSGFNMYKLTTDISNSPSVANTIIDIPNLIFPVNIGKTYYFRYVLIYHSDATTTGSRFNIYGPSANTLLSYQTRNTLNSTSTTNLYGSITYNVVTASNATSAATSGNNCIIEGFLTADVTGFVTPSFACEVGGGTITIKAESFVQYQQVL